MGLRGGNEPLAKRRTKVNKLIFASLVSVGAMLAAQTPAAQAPAASSKTVAKKTVKKHHSKKPAAVSNNTAKPVAK
jgi:hypothetical protein